MVSPPCEHNDLKLHCRKGTVIVWLNGLGLSQSNAQRLMVWDLPTVVMLVLVQDVLVELVKE